MNLMEKGSQLVEIFKEFSHRFFILICKNWKCKRFFAAHFLNGEENSKFFDDLFFLTDLNTPISNLKTIGSLLVENMPHFFGIFDCVIV